MVPCHGNVAHANTEVDTMPRNLYLAPKAVDALVPESLGMPRLRNAAELQQCGRSNLAMMVGLWQSDAAKLSKALQTDTVIEAGHVVQHRIRGLQQLMDHAPNGVPLFPVFRPHEHHPRGNAVVCFVECADREPRWPWQRCAPHLREGFVASTVNGTSRTIVIVSFERVSNEMRGEFAKDPRGNGHWYAHTDPRIMRPEELAYLAGHEMFRSIWLACAGYTADSSFSADRNKMARQIERLERNVQRVK